MARFSIIRLMSLAISLASIVACDSGTTKHHTVIRCDDIVMQADIEQHSVTLFIHDDAQVLKRKISASGEKYQSERILLWLKGEDALVRFGDENFKDCKVIGE